LTFLGLIPRKTDKILAFGGFLPDFLLGVAIKQIAIRS
jgi:hypothetical protein